MSIRSSGTTAEQTATHEQSAPAARSPAAGLRVHRAPCTRRSALEGRPDDRPRLLFELAPVARPPETVQVSRRTRGGGTFFVTVASNDPTQTVRTARVQV